MTYGITDQKNYSDIANAIRSKLDISNTYTPVDMPSGIRNIPSQIYQDKFYQAIGISGGSIYDSSVTDIGSYAFFSRNSLQGEPITNVTFTECKNIHLSAFCNCTDLTSISFPECTTIGNYVFDSCTNLVNVSFPNCITIGSYAFQRCSNLTSVSFPKCRVINSSAFFSCSKLESIHLLYNSAIIQLKSTDAFVNTPISDSTYLGHFGSIYVPSSLVSQYKSATNWSVYASRIVGVEI